jgi:hypothetical protein
MNPVSSWDMPTEPIAVIAPEALEAVAAAE